MRIWYVASCLVFVGTASAEPTFDPAATTWLGADLEILPHGSLKTSSGPTTNASAATAYALGGTLEYLANPWLSVAFMPRYLIDIGPADAVSGASGQSAPTGSELDLRMRVAVRTEPTPRLRLYGYASPGFAYGFEPSGVMTLHPHGAIIGIGGGAAYATSMRSALTFDIGYQWGFQSYDAPGGSVTDRTSYMHVAIGIAHGY
jgi:hypothetical protein